MHPIAQHPGQLEVWKSKARFKFFVAGRRFGKTYLIIEQLLKHSDKPRADVVYIAPTRTQGKDLIWEKLKERCRQLGWRFRPNELELKIYRANKATIQIMGAHKPNRLRGRGYTFVAMDEFAEYLYPEIWPEIVRPALSDRQGHALFAMTPKGFNHAYDLYNQAKAQENWQTWQFKTIDAPHFQTPEGKAEIEEARRNLSERDFKQEYEATFQNFSGRIYSGFDREKNHVDYKYNPNLPIIVGMDFNRSPMTATVSQKVSGTLITFDEVFLQASRTEEAARVIENKYGSKAVTIRPDATGSRRTSNSNVSDHQILREFGFKIDVNPSNPKRVDRWSAVNRAFERGLNKVDTNKCLKLTRDLETLCYKEGSCEPMLSDPMLGHISDAHGYKVTREFPIVGKAKRKAY